jgi:hypothetical protein
MPFEAMAKTLLKGGVAPRHVRRYVRELDDHLGDLTAQKRQAGYDDEDAALRARALLGDDRELAQAMLEQPGVRSWPARLPWLVFGILPPLAALALFFLALLPLVGLANLLHMISAQGIAAPYWFRILTRVITDGGNLLLAPSLAALLTVIAWRQHLRAAWPTLAIALIAAMGMQYNVQFPPKGVHGGELGIGALIWLHHSDDVMRHWQLGLAQLLLTLLPAVLLLRKTHRLT